MTPRLDILNRMPGVRIQSVGGGAGNHVVARKSAPPLPAPAYHEEFSSAREEYDGHQIDSGVGGAEFNDIKRARKAHSEKIFATPEQKKILMDHYLVNNYPSIEDMTRMTEETGLDERFLKQWFQYTRKFMKSKGKAPVRIEQPPPTVSESVEYETCVSKGVEKDYVNFQYDPMDAVETRIESDSFTHEEAIEKAMQYDELKKKFDELHKNFMRMSNALLKKGYKGHNEDIMPTPQRLTSPVHVESEMGKDESQENNGDKTLNGPFRPPADSTSTPLVARVKQEKEGEAAGKKGALDNDDKDDASKNMNLPHFPQEPNPSNPYAPPYHPGPYPPHPMYPPYQAPYNPNLPPHMQPPPNWPPYQPPSGWNPSYPPYPPPYHPTPGATGQAPAGYPPNQSYPPPPSYPGQTPPPSNPFHSTPPPPQPAGQTPPPPQFGQTQHPPYPPNPHPYHLSGQYQTPPEPPHSHLYNTYNSSQETHESLQMKSEDPVIKTELVSPRIDND